jgi:integrase
MPDGESRSADSKRRRRGNNEGSITQRKDGRWEARISLGTGKRHALYGKTRREVQDKLKAALRALDGGQPPVPQRETLGQFLSRWLEDEVKRTRRYRTYESYCSLVRVHIDPALGRRKLALLGPREIQGFLNEKQDDGLSASTVKYLHAVLHRALGQAVRWGLAQRNAASLVTPPRVVREEVKVWTPEEARTFLNAIDGHRLEALYSVALAVGLRQGEALGLRWDDVDLAGATLTVRRQLQRVDGVFQLVETKTDRSRRTVALPTFAVAALRAHRSRQLEDRMLAGQDWQGDAWGLVFMTRRGTPLDAKNVTHRFQDLLARLGLSRMRFHDLRHACASLMLAQGEHPRVVMETLGHSQISMTMNTYSHVIPALQREAASRMDRLLAGTTNASASGSS